MKVYLKNLPFVVFFITFFASAQCDRVETLIFCDMTTIDGNTDGTPDGVINLYDEYTSQIGGTLAPGTWFDPGFNFALDEATGDLFLWDLNNASVNITDYQFELTNPNCTTGPTITLNVILGPYSGDVVPTIGTTDVNVQICDLGEDPCGSMAETDLKLTFLSLPSPHSNGRWEYRGTSPNFISLSNDGIFMAEVPYTPGPPLIDEEIFEVFYIVDGLTPCDAPVQETSIRVSVIREVFAGFANTFDICETELVAGSIFENIDLRNDEYLVNEDIEGVWLAADDPTGQISGPGDSMINLVEIYNDLVAANPTFGCATYDFTFMVTSRTNVCEDNESTVSFTIYQELKPFSQVTFPDYCVKDDTNPTTVNLYEFLEFTPSFEYGSNCCTDWNFVSGPSDLGIVDRVNDICSDVDTSAGSQEADYTYLGTISLEDLTNADAGTYIFEYTVNPGINCSCEAMEISALANPATDGCSSITGPDYTCASITEQVTIVINPFNYAGEDTPAPTAPALEFCESDITSPFDLITLLNTDGINDPIYTGTLGTWIDLDTGLTITNPYTFPEIDDRMTFNFNYSTTTPANCTDTADLTFTVYEQYTPGIPTTREFCETDSSFNLFDELDVDPLFGDINDNGTWTFPDGTMSSGSMATFDPSTDDGGVYTYTVPNNFSITDGTTVICPGGQATLTITIIEPANPGMDMAGEVCESSLQYDLLTLLDPAADTGGMFIDATVPPIPAGALSGSIVDITLLAVGVYEFDYQVQGNIVCPIQTATLTLTIFEEFTSGTDTDHDVCAIDANFNIFDELDGSPSTNGTWTLPDGTMSTNNNVTFDPSTSDAGVYIYTVPPNMSTIDPTIEICSGSSNTLTINVFQNSNPGADNDGVACKSDLEFDLLTLVDPAADTGGAFVDVTMPPIPTGALSGNIVDLTLLAEGDYIFEYQTQGNTVCALQAATLELIVTDLLSPTVDNETFCVLEAATLADLTVNGASDFEWYDTATDNTPLDINTILIDGEDYFVAATDASATCFSTRTVIIASIIPFGEQGCVVEIPDGVSPNNDSQNDDLDLSNLPQIYPNYEIKIFNRYGTTVFIGNTNTAFFNGESNVSLSIGNNLPSGNYFYIFDPKDNITKPFQGNFYLSR